MPFGWDPLRSSVRPTGGSRINAEPRTTGIGGGAIVGAPGAGGYYGGNTSRIDNPSRVTGTVSGTRSVLGAFGFSTTGEAVSWGFNPTLKRTDAVGGEVTGEEIESSRNQAVVDVTLASQGSGDYLGFTAPSGVNPGVLLLGVAAVALVGYSFLK